MTEAFDLTEDDRRRLAREVFLLMISILAMLNAIAFYLGFLNLLDERVILTMNALISLFFLTDFLIRIFTFKPRAAYFFKKYGWASLLSCIPIPAFAFFRIFPSVRVVREIRAMGGRGALRDLTANRASGALFLALFLALLLVELSSATIVTIEANNPDANIKTAGDAIWWSYVTITTIGYGDRYPVTGFGRLVGGLLMTVGVGLFSVVTGYLANAFLGGPQSSKQDTAPTKPVSITAELDESLSEVADLQKLLLDQQAMLVQLQAQLERLEARVVSGASGATGE